jgi:hypothetical protein
MVSIKITNDKTYGIFWAASIDGYRFMNSKTVFIFQQQFGIIASGSGCITGPTEFVKPIIT